MTRDDILYLSPATPPLFTAIVKETLVHRNMLVFFMQIHFLKDLIRPTLPFTRLHSTGPGLFWDFHIL